MARQLFTDWRDEQAQQTYPFQDHAEPLRFDGGTIPPGVILDANLHAPNSTGGYYLESVAIGDGSVTFNIADHTRSVVAVGVFSAETEDATVVPLYTPADTLLTTELPAGVLVINPDLLYDLVEQWGEGRFDIQQTTSGFVPSTWEYFSANTDDGQQQIIEIEGVPITTSGDAYFVAEDGVRFTCEGGNRVRVHAIGDPLAARKLCEASFQAPRYIREIVFQHNAQTIACNPGPDGEVHVLVAGLDGQRSAMRVSANSDGLKFGFASRTNR